MDKKCFLQLMTIMMVVVMGLNLFSCGKDDGNNGEHVDENNLLVGKWLYENFECGNFYDVRLLLFEANGTFRYTLQEIRENESDDIESSDLEVEGTYLKDGDAMMCIVSKTSNSSKIAVGTALRWNIRSLSKEKLILNEENVELYYTFGRTSYDALLSMRPSSIVGKWVYDSFYYKGERKVTDREIYYFQSNGTGYRETWSNEDPDAKDLEMYSKDDFTYIYDKKNMLLKIKWDGWTDYQEDELYMITQNHMVLWNYGLAIYVKQ